MECYYCNTKLAKDSAYHCFCNDDCKQNWANEKSPKALYEKRNMSPEAKKARLEEIKLRIKQQKEQEQEQAIEAFINTDFTQIAPTY